MSDYKVIRGVTLSLMTLLEDNLKQQPYGLTVNITCSRPDAKQDTTGSRLNLYLYQVLENHFLTNQEDPRIGTTRDYGRPPLSLNLHYLLTPFSANADELDAHLILGAAMQVLHENALLLPKMMTSGGQTVLDSSLWDALEHLRLSLLQLTLDDLAKIWTETQQSMRLSVGYEVTVAQIDPVRPRVSPLSVRERNVIVTQRGPQISSIVPDVAGIGDALTINGSGFASAMTKVLIGSAVMDLSGLGTATLRGDRVQTSVPDDPSLWPGAQLLRVQVGFDPSNALATGAFPKTVASNQEPILIVPKVTAVSPASAPVGSTHALTISGHRLWRAQEDANVFVQIADQTISALDFTSKSATQIEVIVRDLPPGQYPVHVRFNAFVSRDKVLFEVTP